MYTITTSYHYHRCDCAVGERDVARPVGAEKRDVASHAYATGPQYMIIIMGIIAVTIVISMITRYYGHHY